MTKVLVTGGAGFIASHLTNRLLERGDDVLVIDNFATARRDTLDERDGLRVVEGSIADTKLVDELFDEFKPDVVAHAAASYKDPDDWDEDARTNAVGTANVVQAAERTGVGRLVYFQTALCYGIHPEEQPITLKHPTRPLGIELCDLKDRRRVVRAAEQARLGLVPPRERLRTTQSQRPAANVLPAAHRR